MLLVHGFPDDHEVWPTATSTGSWQTSSASSTRSASTRSASWDTTGARLPRPGRLTAGFNYYRAKVAMLLAGHGAPVKVPVVGVWSGGPNHWLQLDDPGTVNRLLLEHLH